MTLTQHIVPLNDLDQHQLTTRCWCHPDVENQVSPTDLKIIKHYAADLRGINEVLTGITGLDNWGVILIDV